MSVHLCQLEAKDLCTFSANILTTEIWRILQKLFVFLAVVISAVKFLYETQYTY